jgi:hypothetical protein
MGLILILLLIARTECFRLIAILFTIFCAAQVLNLIFAVYTCYKWKVEQETDFQEKSISLFARPFHPRCSYSDVRHFVIIPNYNEDLQTLERTIEKIQSSALSRYQIGICLAMEEREGPVAKEKAASLENRYSEYFWKFFVSYHPSNTPGEISGKGSNSEYAFKYVTEKLQKVGQDMSRVVFTNCDADSQFHMKYFDALTYYFLEADVSSNHNDDNAGSGSVNGVHDLEQNGVKSEEWMGNMIIWQAPILHTSNILTVPAITRIVSQMILIHELASSSNPIDIHLPFSTYSFSWMLWKQIKGLDTNNVAEDWRIYLKAYLETHGKARVNTILLPTQATSVQAGSYIESISERFTQACRHAWGVSEISWFLQELYSGKHTKIGSVMQIGVTGLFYQWNLLFRMIEAHAVPALLFLYVNLGWAIYNYYNWFYVSDSSSKEIEAEILRIGTWFVQVNVVLLLTQAISVYLFLAVLEKLKGQDTGTLVTPSSIVYYYIEYLVLSFPAIIVTSIIPEWYQVTRLFWSSDFYFRVAPKKTSKVTE